MAARRALIAAVIASVLAACQVAQRVPPVIVHVSHVAPSRDTFERVLSTVRAHGYEVHGEDLAGGTFRVTSRYADRGVPIGSHAFAVQLYASGHVEITAVGPRVEHDGDAYVMPPALRRELVGLAQALDR